MSHVVGRMTDKHCYLDVPQLEIETIRFERQSLKLTSDNKAMRGQLGTNGGISSAATTKAMGEDNNRKLFLRNMWLTVRNGRYEHIAFVSSVNQPAEKFVLNISHITVANTVIVVWKPIGPQHWIRFKGFGGIHFGGIKETKQDSILARQSAHEISTANLLKRSSWQWHMFARIAFQCTIP